MLLPSNVPNCKITFLLLSLLVLVPSITVISAINQPLQYELSPNLLGRGSPAIDWTLEEILSDKDMTFSSFTGKVVLMDFFATWCAPCQYVISTLKDIKKLYSSNDLVLISMDTDPGTDSEAILEDFASQYGIDWYMFRDTISVSVYYEITSIPTIYIFDQSQYVYFSNVGVPDSSSLINTINALLSPSPTNPPPTSNPPSTSNPPASTPPPTTTSKPKKEISPFWEKNWYWFLIGGIVAIFATYILIKRQAVVSYNKKIQEEKRQKKAYRARKRRRAVKDRR